MLNRPGGPFLRLYGPKRCVCVVTGAWIKGFGGIIFVPIGTYSYRGRSGKKVSPQRDYLEK